MGKVAIVYWSGTGNTEAMAKLVAQGVEEAAGAPDVMTPGDFNSGRSGEFDGIAFGCPAMGAEELEEMEFAPMWEEAKASLSGQKVALFGSYDWADGEWMRLWEQEARDAGIDVVDALIAKDYPDGEASAACIALGKKIAG